MTDTDIAAVIARVRTAWRGEYRGGVQRTVELDASDRDALIAHIDAQAARIAELEHERDEARGVAHARAVAVDTWGMRKPTPNKPASPRSKARWRSASPRETFWNCRSHADMPAPS